ncbi:MAG: DUF6259 domain-containing protein [Bifidobacteriaceae bacterium]|jgi:hypothetical protein|nr:DUF6259 domain-containing protein [Bifidobacteriaceae bacterium]
MRDDFTEASLGPPWSVFNFAPGGPRLSLTDNPGNLRLTVPGGRPYDQWIGVDDAPEVSRTDMGNGNFAVETAARLVDFREGDPFTVGLSIRFGSGDVLLWGPTVGVFLLEAVRSGSPQLVSFKGFGASTVFLRAERSGNVFSFFHKFAAADRWIADGQYRPPLAPVASVGLMIKTWTDSGAAVTVDFDYFVWNVGTLASDDGANSGNVQTFGNACTRYVPKYGPLISVPPNIPGQAVPNKNLRILIPDSSSFDHSPGVDEAPQLLRADCQADQWTLQTVLTAVYADPNVYRAGLIVRFAQFDLLYWELTSASRLALGLTGSGDVLSIPYSADRVWLQVTRAQGEYTAWYRETTNDPWVRAGSLSVGSLPVAAGIIAATGSAAAVAIDFGFLSLESNPSLNTLSDGQHRPGAAPSAALHPAPHESEDTEAAEAGAPQAALESYGSGQARESELVIENDVLRISVGDQSGAIWQIENKTTGQLLVDPSFPRPAPEAPWRLETAPGSEERDWLTPTEAGARFRYAIGPAALELIWECENSLVVRSTIAFDAETSEAVIDFRVDNSGATQVSVLEYPSLTGISDLGSETGNRLLHPFATGFLFREPLEVFGPGTGIPPSPYPEGFNGAPLQMMAYYTESIGGFLVRCDDTTGWVKWFDFIKDSGSEHLKLRLLHSATGVGPGNQLAVPYTVRIAGLREGSWEEAADKYREWAEAQDEFCGQGPLRDRADKARWLLEDVGLSVFGINTQYDRGPWLRYFHELTGSTVFHITGPNWPAGRWDYLGNQSGGSDRVLPSAIVDSYRDTLDSQGDRFATFAFATTFTDPSSSDYPEASAAMQSIPGRDTPGFPNRLSRDSYDFSFMCPVPAVQQRLSVYRDETAVGRLGASGVYYDIGPNNVMLRCLDAGHGHAAGGGSVLTQAYRRVLAAVKRACASAAGQYVPLGCEMANEVFIPEMDFYQARAEASPASSFEAWSFYGWIKDGSAEKVPLFAYIYHEYGPIRLDGWGRLDNEQGDLFYWIAARVFAWGGIYEINCEFSNLNSVAGHRDDITESFSSFCVDRYYDVAQDKADFLKRLAAARTGFANKYLAYGAMIRPLEFDNNLLDRSWFHFNSPPDSQEYQDGGVLRVPAVIHCGWRFARESCGFVFVNTDLAPTEISVRIDPSKYGLDDLADLRLFQVDSRGEADLGPVDGPTEVTFVAPDRSPTMLELRRAPA